MRRALRLYVELSLLFAAAVIVAAARAGGDPSTCAYPELRKDGPIAW